MNFTTRINANRTIDLMTQIGYGQVNLQAWCEYEIQLIALFGHENRHMIHLILRERYEPIYDQIVSFLAINAEAYEEILSNKLAAIAN